MAKGKKEADAGKSSKSAAGKRAQKPKAAGRIAGQPTASAASEAKAKGKRPAAAKAAAKSPRAVAAPKKGGAAAPKAGAKRTAKKPAALPHLDGKTLKRIVVKLEELRLESLRVVNMHVQADMKKREESGDVGDDMDQASSERDREFSLIIHQRHLRRLIQVEEAFERIEDGTYGLCEGTEEPIDPNRLLIMPLARFSIEYQQQQEKMLGRSPEDTLGPSEDPMLSDE